MSSYQDILGQIDELQKRAEQARRNELNALIKDMREKIALFDISKEDLFGPGASRARRALKKSLLPPRYRDPETGATWSGRGRVPAWLNGKNRSQFEIVG